MGGGSCQRQREHRTYPTITGPYGYEFILTAVKVKADRSETNTSTEDNIKKLQEETAKVASKQ